MYEEFYGLHERPFDLTPNPRFLFMTASHRDALAAMQYAITGRKGLTLVLGPPGTGKTTLVHAAMERQEGNVRAVYLGNPTLTREEFYEFLAQELGLSTQAQASKAQFLRELRADLVARRSQGAVTALVIDEAQAMADGLLEELRLLENLETPSEKLLPVVLVGQPELAVRLRQPALLPLRQRVSLKFNLSPLSSTEVSGYIAERLRIAGGDIARVFTAEAIEAICQSCGGIPRNISVVCDNALVNGFAVDEKPITAATIAEVCRDFELPLPRGVQAAPQALVPAAVVPEPVMVGPTMASTGSAVPPAPEPPQYAETTAMVVQSVGSRAPALVPTMTNLVLSDAPAFETLMVQPPARDPQDDAVPSRAFRMISKVTSPARNLWDRLNKVEAEE